MTMKNALALMLLPLLISACAISKPDYMKAGTSETQQKQDAYECERDAYMLHRLPMREKERMYRQCMESRGYKIVPGKE
jgi:hypothetical protein